MATGTLQELGRNGGKAQSAWCPVEVEDEGGDVAARTSPVKESGQKLRWRDEVEGKLARLGLLCILLRTGEGVGREGGTG